MYSWEINDYLNKRNYELTPIEFMDLINKSPQIKDVYVELGEYYDKFKYCTDDGYQGYFRMQVEQPKKLTLKRDSD